MSALRPHPDVIETPLKDELVLLDPRNQEMYSLNATGKVIWECLKQGQLEQVAQRLSEAFAVEPAQAQQDADALLADLEHSGLIVRHGP